jgi:undecaprenyl-diphosphatase
MTLRGILANRRWVLPLSITTFVVLSVAAATDSLPWDRPITDAVIGAHSPWVNDLAEGVSFLGSTPMVVTVTSLSVLLARKRCPRLAMAILVIAFARPLLEFTLKELVDRPRPEGARLVTGRGPSFPSGHPLATAASWGLVPLVVALYTRRRVLWWAITVGVWTLAVLVAASRVWLAVHWTTDVIAALLLAVVGYAGAERFIQATHGDASSSPCTSVAPSQDPPQAPEVAEAVTVRG